jgi:hypothetical protein
VVLESEPQLRSLFVYSQTRSTMRVPLPHILFTVRYQKLSSGMFSYPGIYGSGLHVHGNLKPLSDFTDKVVYLPTDYSNYRGLVCTDHGSDNKKFKTVTELVNYVVTHWWSHLHHIDYQPFGSTAWHEAKLEQIPNGKWEKAGTFREALMNRKSYGLPEERSIPMDAKVLDVQWPAKLEVKPFEGPVETEKQEPDRCDCPLCKAERGEY